jgi:hypothetical protein
VKEAEGALKLKVAEREEAISGAIKKNRDLGRETNAPQPSRRARGPLDTEPEGGGCSAIRHHALTDAAARDETLCR